MTVESPSTPQEDLAFLRSVARSGGGGQIAGGSMLALAGGLYGAQCLAEWLQAEGWLRLPHPIDLVVGVGPTVLFLAVFAVSVPGWKRVAPLTAISARAVNGAFSAAGLATLAMAAVFGVAAWKRHDFLIWELYPAVVFALQGAAWTLAFIVRRRGWLMLVGAGWLISSVVLGPLIGTNAYVLAVGISLVLFMLVPGLVLMRLSRKAG